MFGPAWPSVKDTVRERRRTRTRREGAHLGLSLSIFTFAIRPPRFALSAWLRGLCPCLVVWLSLWRGVLVSFTLISGWRGGLRSGGRSLLHNHNHSLTHFELWVRELWQARLADFSMLIPVLSGQGFTTGIPDVNTFEHNYLYVTYHRQIIITGAKCDLRSSRVV
jgi:hypothetical protein